MTEDEVVSEVRVIRDAFAASHGYDIQAMAAALREIGIVSGRVVVRLAPRTVRWPVQPPVQARPEALVSGASSELG